MPKKKSTLRVKAQTTTPAKIFISYRHVKPDQELANFLHDFLTSKGHEVFFDKKIKAGFRWAQEIDEQIRSAEFFLVLTSKAATESDMVRGEIELARELLGKNLKPHIIPIQVGTSVALRYDLRAWLNPFQMILWEDKSDNKRVGNEILTALSSPSALAGSVIDARRGNLLGKQTKAAAQKKRALEKNYATKAMLAHELETGVMSLTSPYYVEREVDLFLREQLTKKSGSATTVRGARKTGKSSLLLRVKDFAERKGDKTLFFDFNMLDETELTNLDAFLKKIASTFLLELRLKRKPEDSWDSRLGSKKSLTHYLENVVLSGFTEPFILILDDADRLLRYDYYEDFFSLLRGWHNRKAEKQEVWKKLHLVIAHSTDTISLSQNQHPSPFNIDERKALDPFSLTEISRLNGQYRGSLKIAEVEQLAKLLGGQPFLTQQSLFLLNERRISFKQLLESAHEDRGPFGDHLRSLVWTLREVPELQSALWRVMNEGVCNDEMIFQRLRQAGLIVGEERNKVQIHSEVYQQYFRGHL